MSIDDSFACGSLDRAANQVARIATGQYTGDGSLGLAITGVGFRPKYVEIFRHVTVETTDVWTGDAVKIDMMAGTIAVFRGLDHLDTRILSLDADGFTVSDDGANADPNIADQLYDYVCLG